MPAPRRPDDAPSEPSLTRRQLLGGAGAVAAGAVAGCGDDGEQVVHTPEVFGHAFPYDPEIVDVNPWPGTAYPSQFYTIMFECQSTLVPGRGRALTDLVADVSVDGATATVTYDDSFRWWNGDPVTAGDQLVYERIQSAVAASDRPDVERVDEYRLRYSFDEPVAEEVALSHVTGEALITAEWLFADWVERFATAGTDAAHEDVVDELHEWRIPLDQAMERGFGNGPYELTEVSLNRIMLERFADHPRADDVDVPRLWFPVLGEVSREKFVQSGETDGGRGLLERMRGTPPEYIEQFDRYQTTNGRKLVLDWRNRHLGRRDVRRAMVAVLALDRIAEIGRFGDPKPVQTGLSEPAERGWLDDEVVSSLERYPLEADSDLAATYMRAAGYERDRSGDWQDADGETVHLRFRSPMWEDWQSSADYLADALRSFGFDVDMFQVPNTRLFTDVRTRNFDVLLWYSDARPFQVFDLSKGTAATLGYGLTDPTVESSEQGKPVEVTVPTPEGDRSVNLVERSRQLRRGEDVRGAVETFVRWWNHAIPDVQIATQVTGVWGNTRDFDWPPVDGTAYRAAGPGNRPEYRLLKRGLVRSDGD